jgi:tryptophan halogenase
MDKRVRHIVVIGGGSAGWIRGCAHRCKNSTNDVDSSNHLVGSAVIGTIGVGSTWPTMRNTAKDRHGSETEFIRQ